MYIYIRYIHLYIYVMYIYMHALPNVVDNVFWRCCPLLMPTGPGRAAGATQKSQSWGRGDCRCCWGGGAQGQHTLGASHQRVQLQQWSPQQGVPPLSTSCSWWIELLQGQQLWSCSTDYCASHTVLTLEVPEWQLMAIPGLLIAWRVLWPVTGPVQGAQQVQGCTAGSKSSKHQRRGLIPCCCGSAAPSAALLAALEPWL